MLYLYLYLYLWVGRGKLEKHDIANSKAPQFFFGSGAVLSEVITEHSTVHSLPLPQRMDGTVLATERTPETRIGLGKIGMSGSSHALSSVDI